MGNSIITRRKKKAKVVKIDGDTFKLKTPATVRDATKDYPGHVLFDSEAVKRFGIRAKQLEPSQELMPKKTYFLVELPNLPPDPPQVEERRLPYRRVSSSVHVGAKERLEFLMLSRRSVSDLSIVRSEGRDGPGPVRVKLRLPRSQVAKLVEESRDDTEVAEKIIGLYMESSGEIDGSGGRRKPKMGEVKANFKAREKRVSFAVEEVGGTAGKRIHEQDH